MTFTCDRCGGEYGADKLTAVAQVYVEDARCNHVVAHCGHCGVKEIIFLGARQLEDVIRTNPEFFRVLFELFSLGRHNAEVASAFEELLRRTREQVAEALRAKADEGVLDLRASPEAVADVLFSLADGLALRILGEPGVDHQPTVDAAVLCARSLLS